MTGKMYPVFVYGTLKNGFCNHRILRYFHGMEAFTTGSSFVMTGSFIPNVYDYDPDLDSDYKPGKIKGELYLVDHLALERMDTLEGHPYNYKREHVEVMCSNEFVDAYMYKRVHRTMTKPLCYNDEQGFYYEH